MADKINTEQKVDPKVDQGTEQKVDHGLGPNFDMSKEGTQARQAAAAAANLVQVGFEPPGLRLPSDYLMMTKSDYDKKGKWREGGVGFKDAAGHWKWKTYSEMKSIIDFMIENKELFNSQLKIEREQQQVADL